MKEYYASTYGNHQMNDAAFDASQTNLLSDAKMTGGGGGEYFGVLSGTLTKNLES